MALLERSWENILTPEKTNKHVTEAAWTAYGNEHSTMHIFFHVLGKADKWYTFLLHKILTECKDIFRLHSSVQMTDSVQTSMKYLIKYFHLNSKFERHKTFNSFVNIRKSLVLLRSIYIYKHSKLKIKGWLFKSSFWMEIFCIPFWFKTLPKESHHYL